MPWLGVLYSTVPFCRNYMLPPRCSGLHWAQRSFTELSLKTYPDPLRKAFWARWSLHWAQTRNVSGYAQKRPSERVRASGSAELSGVFFSGSAQKSICELIGAWKALLSSDFLPYTQRSTLAYDKLTFSEQNLRWAQISTSYRILYHNL